MKVTFDRRALRKVRAAKGLDVREAAKRARISRQSFYSLEQGKQEPGATMLAKLASGLEVSVSVFFVEND